jgi:protoheme IX farnesyltransferase
MKNSIIEICKPRIVKMVVMTAAMGYALGFPFDTEFSVIHLFLFLLGTASISAGSLALNSAQEWELDKKMQRTRARPIPSGRVPVQKALQFSWALIVLGLVILFSVSIHTAWIGLATVVLYNGLYTLLLKRRSAFAAVPGAVPGAAPVLMGYAAINPKIFTHESVYVFLLMFLWQMPHFWALAIRYMDDYASGGFPVLPVALGKQKTLYHMGLYIIPYIALAVLSPRFVEVGYAYYILVLPLAFISVFEFYKFLESKGEKNWVKFFIWINLSMLGFLAAPVIDKWYYYLFKGVMRQ